MNSDVIYGKPYNLLCINFLFSNAALIDNFTPISQYSFMDSSTMVREAAVDLLGKFILHNQDLITQYYKIITDRILVSFTFS